jgi:hypothetical protein
MFKAVKPITLRSSLRSLTLHLWDEEGKQLIGFGDIKSVLSKRLMTSRQ